MNNLSNIDIKTLEEHNISITKDVINKINNGYPLQYIVGDVNFYGYNFKVNEDVLIPRFETEQLIEHVLNKKIEINSVLDICSGSGVIGITMALKTNASVDMLEISSKAVEVCKHNIDLHHLNDKVRIINDDLFKYNIMDNYDLIISNPPYLTHQDNVSSNTRFEPDIALYSNDDNIKYYKYIIDQVSNFHNWKLIAFEIGETEGNDIINYAKDHGLTNIYCLKDYNNCDRFIFIEKNE